MTEASKCYYDGLAVGIYLVDAEKVYNLLQPSGFSKHTYSWDNLTNTERTILLNRVDFLAARIGESDTDCLGTGGLADQLKEHDAPELSSAVKYARANPQAHLDLPIAIHHVIRDLRLLRTIKAPEITSSIGP